MRIAVIGAGYVGLVSGACFSEFGIDVVCVDRDENKVALLQRGQMPVYEPGLAALVKSNAEAGRLSFTTALHGAVAEAEAVFIAVGTPCRCDNNGHADLSDLFEAAREVAEALRGYTVVVIKSTVPVGTGRKVESIIRATRQDIPLDVVSNPEFLREGSAIHDFVRPDRVVVGTDSERAREVMRQLYRMLYLRETPILFTNLETSELIKYAANTFLSLKIAFINEMADLCERIGTDVCDVAHGIGLDSRIGHKFLHPGPGYGGSCFPKDTLALVHTARDHGVPLRIVETVVDMNKSRKKEMAGRIIAACGGSVSGKTIAVLGLTFKPNTDDMRESPSLDIIPALQKAGAAVRAFDPEGMNEARKIMPDILYCPNAYETMKGAEALVILTEWNEFRSLDLGRMRRLLKELIVVDLRNIYDPSDVMQAGFQYTCIGRSSNKTL